MSRRDEDELIQTYNVFDQLRPVSADGLDGLEDIDLPVLDDLLDAGVGGAVNAGARLPVPAEEDRSGSD